MAKNIVELIIDIKKKGGKELTEVVKNLNELQKASKGVKLDTLKRGLDSADASLKKVAKSGKVVKKSNDGIDKSGKKAASALKKEGAAAKKAATALKRQDNVAKKSAKSNNRLADAFQGAANQASILNGPLNGVSGRLSSISSGLKNTNPLVLGTAAAFAALTAAASKSLQTFGETERTLNRLSALIKTTGNNAGFTGDQLEVFSQNLAKSTLASLEGVRDAVGIALTFDNIRTDNLERALVISQDLSEVVGQDLTSSITQVSKALQDPIKGYTALKRVGVSFTESQIESIKIYQRNNDILSAQGIILETLEKQYGGAAKGAAQGFLGALDTLGQSVENLTVRFGELISEGSGVNELILSYADSFELAERRIKKSGGNIVDLVATTIAALLLNRDGVGKALESEDLDDLISFKDTTKNITKESLKLTKEIKKGLNKAQKEIDGFRKAASKALIDGDEKALKKARDDFSAFFEQSVLDKQAAQDNLEKVIASQPRNLTFDKDVQAQSEIEIEAARKIVEEKELLRKAAAELFHKNELSFTAKGLRAGIAADEKEAESKLALEEELAEKILEIKTKILEEEAEIAAKLREEGHRQALRLLEERRAAGEDVDNEIIEERAAGEAEKLKNTIRKLNEEKDFQKGTQDNIARDLEKAGIDDPSGDPEFQKTEEAIKKIDGLLLVLNEKLKNVEELKEVKIDTEDATKAAKAIEEAEKIIQDANKTTADIRKKQAEGDVEKLIEINNEERDAALKAINDKTEALEEAGDLTEEVAAKQVESLDAVNEKFNELEGAIVLEDVTEKFEGLIEKMEDGKISMDEFGEETDKLNGVLEETNERLGTMLPLLDKKAALEEQADKNAVGSAKERAKLAKMEIKLLRLQGKELEALKLEREEAEKKIKATFKDPAALKRALELNKAIFDVKDSREGARIAIEEVKEAAEEISEVNLTAAIDIKVEGLEKLQEALKIAKEAEDTKSIKKLEKAIKELGEEVDKTSKFFQDMFQSLEGHMNKAIIDAGELKEVFGDAIDQEDSFRKTGEALENMLRQSLADFGAELISNAITGAILGAVRIALEKALLLPGFKYLADAFAGIFDQQSSTEDFNFSSILAGLGGEFSFFHEGSAATNGGQARTMSVNPSVFKNAPRYHTGLNNKELPAILEKTEAVLTAKQTADINGAMQSMQGAGGAGGIRIENKFASDDIINDSSDEVMGNKVINVIRQNREQIKSLL